MQYPPNEIQTTDQHSIEKVGGRCLWTLEVRAWAVLSPRETLQVITAPAPPLCRPLIVWKTGFCSKLEGSWTSTRLSNWFRPALAFPHLERDKREQIWGERVVATYGPLDISPHGSWKVLAKQLHQGVGSYRGYSLDPLTSTFQPYPMDISFSRQPNDISRIRWRTLRDSITRVDVRERSRNSQGELLDVQFVEAELLHGENILIPNAYYGRCQGPYLLGVYPKGAFCTVRSEAMQPSRHESSSEFQVGTTMNGFAVGEAEGLQCFTRISFTRSKVVRISGSNSKKQYRPSNFFRAPFAKSTAPSIPRGATNKFRYSRAS